MTQTLTHRDSPLMQADRHERITLAGSARELSPDDQATLRQILVSKCDFVDNKLFHKSEREATRVIFDEAPAIARPDTSWYHPVMDNLTPESRLGKHAGTVLLTAKQEVAL